MTAVSSAALLAAWTAAFRTLIRIFLTSIIQIRQTAAKRKSGIPMDASAVTLPLFVPEAADETVDLQLDTIVDTLEKWKAAPAP